MARTRSTYSRERITVIRKFPWPDAQLNWWTIVMLATGGLILGVFADFMSIQQQMGLGIPWLFPYGITVGSLTVLFIIIMIIMVAQNKLDPSAVILGCFILIVLFIAGLIETAVQLFGNGNVSTTCDTYVANNKVTGVSLDTLAWLEQNAICNEWDAVFAFWIVGLVFLIWMIIMASQVLKLTNREKKKTENNGNDNDDRNKDRGNKNKKKEKENGIEQPPPKQPDQREVEIGTGHQRERILYRSLGREEG